MKIRRIPNKEIISVIIGLILVLSLLACNQGGTATPAPTGDGGESIIIPSITPTVTPAPSTTPPAFSPTILPSVTPVAAPPKFDSVSADITLRGVLPSPTTISPIPSPWPSSLLSGTDIRITVDIDNFELVEPTDQSSAPGEGHLQYFIDVAPPITPGQPAVTEEGTFVSKSDTFFIWTDVTPGEHSFSVELVNNDNTPLQPPVVASIVIQVPQPVAPTGPMIQSATVQLEPLSPTTATGSPALVLNFQAMISTIVSNFDLTSSAPQGHILYSLDVPVSTQGTISPSGTPAATGSTQESSSIDFTWPDVSPGIHIFRIELTSNNNSPLNPPVYYEFTITIPSMAPEME